MASYWKIIMAVAFACTSVQVAAADDSCLATAKTELERVYCQVVSEGEGDALPSATDFRRNDPRVQALLLKRPAQRLGISLPGASTEVRKQERTPGRPEPSEPPVSERQEVPDRLSDVTADSSLRQCRLAGEGRTIACPGRRFELATNRPASALASAALSGENRLALASFEGSRDDEEAVRSYLSDAYDLYIRKMLDIGLAGATMSFTAFHNAFHTTEAGGVDFAARLQQTYELLKEDRKTLAVSTGYPDELPESIEFCAAIDRDIVACDNVGTNWVYVSAGR
ncbi:hypothetical protein [Marinobacter sp.]|uniref:hypothetical protein n=1 Tax=Marinobacter sp. TaxID=50741 RepID=UPI00384FC391